MFIKLTQREFDHIHNLLYWNCEHIVEFESGNIEYRFNDGSSVIYNSTDKYLVLFFSSVDYQIFFSA